ncbi:hypothetical protein UCDDA912_g10350 [Diaporthe ampelina]|uniref:Uncharacterized protein n=1 Tax=Diaporthe ampelina TaxID=1214573 RepID=A0A0G2H363_9PEZI|nr:hypothetical protein UCDDA912_g10350 [Diaporthe ampelina]
MGTSSLAKDLHLGDLNRVSLNSNSDSNNDNKGRALFNGNLHSTDFYINGIKSLNKDKYRKKDYAEGTKKLISYPLQQFQAYYEKSLRRD